MNKCNLCPRKCGVKRSDAQIGYCGMSDEIKIGRAALHFWEEPPISGKNGSGTVFFSGCNLKCVFCQNHNLSKGDAGKAISVERLAQIFIELQEQGAHNINLVTPTHYTLQIIEALKIAKQQGLNLPVVYNCSGYESVETLKLLEGYVQIYLPDFKYYSEEQFLRVVELHGADKLLFGSDSPWSRADEEIEILKSMPLDSSQKEKIFHLNAEKLLGLK